MKSSIIQKLALALLATALLLGACKKKKQEDAPAPGSASAAVTPPPPAPDAAAAPAPETAKVLDVAALDAIKLPVPKGAPEDGEWKAQESTKEGSRLAYYGKDKDYYAFVTILDCNLPRMKEDAAKPPAERKGDAGYCLDAFEGKLKDYPMRASGDSSRTVKVGHVVVGISNGPKGTMKGPDLEEFLTKIDLDALAKM